MEKEDAFKIGLPKWPQCVINGEKITQEQAMEIISRTDRFFGGNGGNNHKYNKMARKICRMPLDPLFDYNTNCATNIQYNDYYEKLYEWQSKWGFIGLEYLDNDWISSSWIGGPHGWCHPDGTIAFCNNIGKWPNVEEVYNELSKIAQEFPFLNMTCTLMNDEENYATESLVTMQVINGEVSIIDTISIEKLKIEGIPINFDLIGNIKNENAFPLETMIDFAKIVFKDVNIKVSSYV